ncbi:tagaturonate reductase [Caproiciproducens sp. NJN-50]|uniref:tagaturonate reductase n=1 Tax=Caproiciproducens sp. NJN-50 TaxID=2507162 RepID=UPI0026CEAEE8
MERISQKMFPDRAKHPIRVLQYGEGNFLRAFVDWQIERMNREAGFDAGVAIVQPLQQGNVGVLNEQDCLYTLFLQGMRGSEATREHSVIECVTEAINPFESFDSYLSLAGCETLRLVVSNTTEAGIAFDPACALNDAPPASYPAKLTQFLYRRYRIFHGEEKKGLLIIPCELIDRNGERLKKYVLQYAELWNLEAGFVSWINRSNTFCCSLVDRIVPGYPRDTIKEITKELGYIDNAVDIGELFHLWVIEGPKWIAQEIPFEKAGLNVKIVEDMTPYRTRKVRILNGAHTTLVPVAYLLGLNTVGEAVDDAVAGKFLSQALEREIIPTLDLPRQELEEFAAAVLERFRNPFVKHYLISIALNSFSKYETRVLPSVLEYLTRTKSLPKHLVFSLAALLEFYRGRRGEEKIALQDEENVLALMGGLWSSFDGTDASLRTLVRGALSFEPVWKRDLNQVPGLTEAVAGYLSAIEKDGMKKAVEAIL